MKKVILIGSMPPPIGGVTVHLDRFLHLHGQNGFEVGVLDLKKKILFKKNENIKKKHHILFFFLRSKIVHVHVSNDFFKILLLVISKVLLKKNVYTHHNSIIISRILFNIVYNLCDKVILVNPREIDDAYIASAKTEVIPAFLPPYKIDRLPEIMENELERYERIISSNCYQYTLLNGKDVYGFDLIIEAFHYLSMTGSINDTILVLVDPSGTTREYVKKLVSGLGFKSNKIMHVTDKIDFVSLIRKSTITIRATRTDGDSLSIRESLFYGIPVIASDVTVRPSGTIVFKNEDSMNLAEKMVYAFESNENQPGTNVDYGRKILNVYKSIN